MYVLTAMSRLELFDAMINRNKVLIDGRACLINGLTMEDGSGYSFIIDFVTVNNEKRQIWYNAKTRVCK